MRITAFALFVCMSLAASASGGAVTATVTGGSLHLAGTSGTDEVSVDQSGTNGDEFRVVPGLGTTVNGEFNPLKIGGVTKDIVIELGNGIDSATVNGGDVKRDVVVHGGTAGTLTLMLDGTRVDRDLRIDTPISSVGLSATATTIGRNVRFVSGTAGDQCGFTSSIIRGDLRFEGNGGGDSVSLTACVLRGSLKGDGGDSDDHLALDQSRCAKGVQWVGGLGDDTVALTGDRFDRNVVIDGGDDGDTFTLSGCEFDGQVVLDLGDGGGDAHLSRCDVRKSLRARGGSGFDQLLVEDTVRVGGDLRIDFGDGSNFSDLRHVVVEGDVRCAGGAGNDECDFLGSIVDGSVRADLGAAAPQDRMSFSSSTVHGQVSVRAAGAFLVDFPTTTVDGNVRVETGSATSSVGALGARFRQLRVQMQGAGDVFGLTDTLTERSVVLDAGGGPNTMFLHTSVIGGDFRVNAGSGDDGITINDSIVQGKTHIDLGGGTNTGP